MLFSTRTLLGLVTAAFLAMPVAAHAQSYPERDITFLVPFGAGGSTDTISRQFATQLETVLGGNINVENRPGGSGTIGVNTIVGAEPDGYLIGVSPSEVLTYQPLVNSDLAYQTPDDYELIAKLGDRASVLFVKADAPWATFDEFLADVKARPGEIRAAVSGVGTLSDLVVQQFNKVANVKITTVPFSGGGSEGMIALLGGRVEAYMSSATGGSLGQVQAGKMRALAVFQKDAHPIFPDATSVVDAGYPVTLKVAFYVIAPKGLPAAVRDKLVEGSLEVARSEEFLDFSKSNDFTIDAKGPEETTVEVNELSEEFAGLIKELAQQ